MPLSRIYRQLSVEHSMILELLRNSGDIQRSTGRIEGKLDGIQRQVHRNDQRITRLEDRGRLTTEAAGERQKWMPRDYMTAGAGIAMVLAALLEKTGWTTAVAGLARLYGGK